MASESENILHDDFEILAEEKLHQGFLSLNQLRIKHKLFAGGWSAELERELLLKDEAVGVLLFDPKNDSAVLIKQFRVGAIENAQGPWLVELVAGVVGSREEPADVAIRESQEEANCTPSKMEKICDYYSSPGISNEKITLFCGMVNSEEMGGIFGLDSEHEDIKVVIIPYPKLLDMVYSGQINNAMTIIAVQWLQHHKQELVDHWL